MACSRRDCPLTKYAKFSVGVAFFTPCCCEGTGLYQGLGNVDFRWILQTYYVDGLLVG